MMASQEDHTSQTTINATPDEQVAKTISDELIEKNIVPTDRKDDFLSKLSSGNLKTDDWRIIIEAGIHTQSKVKEVGQ